MKLKDREREVEALRQEKQKAEGDARQLQARVQHFESALKDLSSQQQAARAASEVTATTVSGGDPAELGALLAARDGEIAALKAQLASAAVGGEGGVSAGNDSLNTSSSSSCSARARGGGDGGKRKAGSSGEGVGTAGASMIPRASARAAAGGASSSRKRPPPVGSRPGSSDGNNDIECMESPAKKRSSGNKENEATSAATPGRRGARTPGKTRATPGKTAASGLPAAAGSLDERLALLRQSRQEQQQQQHKSVGFAGAAATECGASSSTGTRMRPLTAPARAGSRLATGAARVSARSAAATKGAAAGEPRPGEEARSQGVDVAAAGGGGGRRLVRIVSGA